MLQRNFLISICCILSGFIAQASSILIPMDNTQKNHLKAYGVAYWILNNDVEVQWLLNYRGGSFMFTGLKAFEKECLISNFSLFLDSY